MPLKLFVTPSSLDPSSVEAATDIAHVLQEVGREELDVVQSCVGDTPDDDPFAEVDPKVFGCGTVIVVAVTACDPSLRCIREVRGAARNDIPTFIVYSGEAPAQIFSSPTICIESVEFVGFLKQLIENANSLRSGQEARTSCDDTRAHQIAETIRRKMPVARWTRIIDATLDMSDEAIRLIDDFESKIQRTAGVASREGGFRMLHAGIERLETEAVNRGFLRSTTDVCRAFGRSTRTSISEMYAVYAELRPRLVAATTTHRDLTEAAQQAARWKANVQSYRALAVGRLLELNGIPSPLTNLDQVRELFAVRESQIRRALGDVLQQTQEDLRRMAGWASENFSDNREVAQMVQRLLKLLNARVECPSCSRSAGIRCSQTKKGATGVFQYTHSSDRRSTNHGGSAAFPSLTLIPDEPPPAVRASSNRKVA